METYTSLKSFVDNPQFHDQRQHSLESLDFDSVDEPIVDLIKDLARLEYCFTLQSCYGHFVYEGHKDRHNIAPLPSSPISDKIEYRIAYIAICLDNNLKGKLILSRLKSVQDVDELNIQFGCAEWFWQRQVNSYVLQVEPDRLKCHDRIFIDYREAKHIEKVRNEFFAKLKALLSHLS